MRRLRPGTARTHRFARSPFIARSAHSVLSARSDLSALSGRSRLSVLAALTSLASLALLATGCAGVEGLQSEGRARDVDAPLVLWPDYSPAPPSRDENPAALVPVPHVPRIPGGSMADANPLAVLNADIAAQGGKPPAPKAVRRPELHDLTDDGKPDLLMAVNLTLATVSCGCTASGARW